MLFGRYRLHQEHRASRGFLFAGVYRRSRFMGLLLGGIGAELVVVMPATTCDW